MEQIQERRTYPRYKMKNLTLAINKKVFGSVIDISLGGMAFEYYSENLNEIDHRTIDIYHMTSWFLISGVQYKVVREYIVNNQTILMPIIKKHCAVQFQEVSYEQLNQFRSFIEQHTIKKE